MDLVDLMAEKRFVGQEFLTWLWFKSEQRGAAVRLMPTNEDVEVFIGGFVALESGEGEALEKVTSQGQQDHLREARLALATGKKIEQARITLKRGNEEFEFLMTGNGEIRGAKLPKTIVDGDGDDPSLDRSGMILDRIGLVERLARTMDELLRLFLWIRTGDAWPAELRQVTEWVTAGAAR